MRGVTHIELGSDVTMARATRDRISSTEANVSMTSVKSIFLTTTFCPYTIVSTEIIKNDLESDAFITTFCFAPSTAHTFRLSQFEIYSNFVKFLVYNFETHTRTHAHLF